VTRRKREEKGRERIRVQRSEMEGKKKKDNFDEEGEERKGRYRIRVGLQ
jgi:hypothetical protein